MKNHPSIALIGFGFLLAAAPAFSGQETEPTVLIEHACQVLMNPDVPRESTLKALTAILDAALLILPKADYTE